MAQDRYGRTLIRLWVPCLALAILPLTGGFGGTYYISTAGSDANNGTTKNTPWLHCPGMPNFSATYTHANGDRFIFKGGESHPAARFTFNINYSGSSASPDYYGVDKTWFTGSVWTKPQFDCGNGPGSAGYQVYVTGRNIQIDNIEFYRYKGPGWFGSAQMIINNADNSPSVTVTNCHFRATGELTTSGATCIQAINGSDVRISFCEFEQFEQIEYNQSVPTGNGTFITLDCVPNVLCASNVGYADHCYFHDTVNALLGGGQWHDNEIAFMRHAYPRDGDVHGNAMEPFVNSTIYNNKIHDFLGAGVNEAILTDPAVPSNYLIFNNIIWNTVNKGIGTDTRRAPANTVNFKIYNNTLGPGAGGIGILSPGTSFPYPASLDVRNNHIANGQSVYFSANFNGTPITPTNDHNLLQSASQAAAAGYTVANAYQPTSGSAPTVNAGVNLASVTTDALGITRPQGGASDIGAYEWNGAGPTPGPTPTPTPTASPVLSISQLNRTYFDDVPAGGTTGDIDVPVTNAGAGTLTDTGITSTNPDITVASGGGYSLTGGQTSTVHLRWRPTVKLNMSANVTFASNGGSQVLGLTGICYPVAGSLTFNADDALVISPFIAAPDHSVSQNLQTVKPATTGDLRIGFTAPSSGDYTVSAVVKALDDASNSLYIGIDTQPIEPNNVWDIVNFTNGFQSRTAGWRGTTGTFNAPQYSPNKWTLTAGLHELIVQGREANTGLGTLTVAPVLAPPNQPPVAGLSANITSGQGPLAVTFTLTSSDSDGVVASGVLNYGDGSSAVNITSPGASTTRSHTYASVGSQTTYNATWVVTDNNSATSNTATQPITVAPIPPPPPNQPPTAGLSVTPISGVIPFAANFTLSSADSDGTVASGVVDYGDGSTPATITSPTASISRSHTYGVAGTYTATWITTDNNGATSSTASSVVTVTAPPIVSLTAPADGTIYTQPANISLTATATAATGGTISKVEFFENNTNIGQDATAPYAFSLSNVTAGNYTLVARATDSNALTTDSAPVSVQVLTSGAAFLPKVFITPR